MLFAQRNKSSIINQGRDFSAEYHLDPFNVLNEFPAPRNFDMLRIRKQHVPARGQQCIQLIEALFIPCLKTSERGYVFVKSLHPICTETQMPVSRTQCIKYRVM